MPATLRPVSASITHGNARWTGAASKLARRCRCGSLAGRRRRNAIRSSPFQNPIISCSYEMTSTNPRYQFMILTQSHLPLHLILAIARDIQFGTTELQQFPQSQLTLNPNLTDENKSMLWSSKTTDEAGPTGLIQGKIKEKEKKRNSLLRLQCSVGAKVLVSIDKDGDLSLCTVVNFSWCCLSTAS